MGDIGLLKQGWRWFHSQKKFLLTIHAVMCCLKEKLGFLIDRHWPFVWTGCIHFSRFLVSVLLQWRNCVVRGSTSLVRLGPVSLFVILWSCFLCFSTASGVLYAHLSLGAAAASMHFLGHNPGSFIIGLFGILLMWIYGKFWISGMLLIAGGCMLSLNHARILMLILTAYALYSVTTRVGWHGVLITINLSFLSNDFLAKLLHPPEDYTPDIPHSEQTPQNRTDPVMEDFPSGSGYEYSTPPPAPPPTSEPECVSAESNPYRATSAPSVLCTEKVSPSCSSSSSSVASSSRVVKSDAASIAEIERIMKGSNHYEVLGVPRSRTVDLKILKKEYHKKVLLVHPDKNMGNPRACESFKKLQCAYEVISDFTKKYNYDEQLRKEESRRTTSQRSRGISQQGGVEFISEESRRIECTKCGNFHLWICTKRSKSRARWCQNCCQYHQARDGDGWVENGSSPLFSSLKVDIPRAFVCAESKIFDVSEWATCQGMECRPNTHGPSFMVNMVGPERTNNQRSGSSRHPWGLDAERIFDDDEFDMWLQQALASGVFPETPKRRKSWTSPFKLNQKGIKHWGRSPDRRKS
ncbi:chaperone DnaJ-domain superfamily protein [Carex rostrata]